MATLKLRGLIGGILRMAAMAASFLAEGHVLWSAEATTTKAFNQSVVFNGSNQVVILSAVVSPDSDEGTIQFTLERMNASTGQLIPVAASVTSTALSNGFTSVEYLVPAKLGPGGYTIRADYTGTANFLPSHHVESILTIFPPGTQLLRLTNSAPITIPDAGPGSVYPSDITVAGQAGIITNLAITLNGLTHPYPGDLDILLAGPGGQRVAIFSNVGGGHSMADIDVTLSDWATFPIPFEFDIPYGSYRPTLYGRPNATEFTLQPPYTTNFSIFNGFSPNGSWSLFVVDVEAPDHGVISGGWSLAINTINHSPTISEIDDQVTSEDTPVGPVSFTIGDLETAPSDLAVSASSSNSLLVPDENIIIAGVAGDRTLTIIPEPDQSGTTFISVVVSDGELRVTNTFAVQVSPVNDPPKISVIADQVGDENTLLGPIFFSISDVETSSGDLTLLGASSNPDLVPPESIIFGGAESNRTVTVTPAANQFGTATLTILVDDGETNTAASFLVTINPVNQAPTISPIPDQSASEDASIGPLEFTIADLETAPENLLIGVLSSNPDLCPPEKISFGGAGGLRSVTITPALNGFGVSLITISVSDGLASSSNSFLVTVNPVNDPPAISTINDQVTDEDTVVGPIWFTISDVETPASELSIQATSSNPLLIPAENIVLGGSSVDRSLTIMPASNQFGAAIIAIALSDGEAAVTNTFLLTVNPINDPPTLSSISDQMADEDTSIGPIAFSIGDVESEAASLVVSAFSSDSILVPTENILLSGTGPDRFVTIIPATNQTGTAAIYIVVGDGDASVTNSFSVEFRPVNDLPTSSVIPDQVVDENGVIGPLAFTVGDIETDAASLTLSALSSNSGLFPDGNIVFGGSGVTRTITLVPATNQFGSSLVTIFVSDGEGINSDVFLVTVKPVNDPPTIDPIDSLTVFQDSGNRVITLTGISAGAETNQSLIVSVTSSNPELIPDPTVASLADESTARLSFTPRPGATGQALITVMVTDNGGGENGGVDSISRSFSVNVVPRPSLRINLDVATCLISFDSVQSVNYLLESKESILETEWTPFRAFEGNGEVITTSDITSPAGIRFYQLRVELK